MHSVSSTAISEVGYDCETRTVVIVFRNRPKPYPYYDVPPEVFAELLAAPSTGTFVNGPLQAYARR
jgi:hypothetical protein